MSRETTLKITVPESRKLSDFQLKLILAAKLYENGSLTSGQASKMVVFSKKEFFNQLPTTGISVFGYSSEEVFHDSKNLLSCNNC